ncbi:MAG TPA: EAL domain-containing protein [Solirubrobacteraceae bacterium]|nr:EAL domain-containing protein [Solirubrobacteraceae bacterium]
MDDNRLQVKLKYGNQLRGSDAVPAADVVRLGRALYQRRAEVISRADELNRRGSLQLDPAAHASVARVIEVSTEAFARWMAGEGEQAARDVGNEAAAIFGQLAIQREAPLNEITKRTLRWRDAAREVIDEVADDLGASLDSRREAHRMLQHSADVTLVRLCEAFESERCLIDDELARRQQELVFMATHDALTGLPNRTLILDRAEQLIARARREHQLCAALFVDLDGFKAVNDGLGHRAGDELLRSVAARLESTIREADTLGRVGGDEFVILADGIALAAGPELVAERILDALQEPFEIDDAHNGRVAISASIGIAMADAHSAADLLRDADIAMYRAKLAGKGGYMVFESGMQDQVHARMELEMDLREALANDEFYVVYQPMFDLGGLAPIRMEALLRWHRPHARPAGPDQFVPLLEESGMIAEVGRWVLREACARCADWAHDGLEIGVAVNVSAVQLEHDEFVQHVRDALAESGIDPRSLTIEITETALMRDAEGTAQRLRMIKDLGVRLSIDDFGTGYSSLAYLQRFPVDELKIDRSFISQIDSPTQRDALIRTFVQLGRSLKIETIAEGIEDHAQLSRLQEERCDIGQGFLFARPMEPDQCREFVEQWVATGGEPLRRTATPPGTSPTSVGR